MRRGLSYEALKMHFSSGTTQEDYWAELRDLYAFPFYAELEGLEAESFGLDRLRYFARLYEIEESSDYSFWKDFERRLKAGEPMTPEQSSLLVWGFLLEGIESLAELGDAAALELYSELSPKDFRIESFILNELVPARESKDLPSWQAAEVEAIESEFNRNLEPQLPAEFLTELSNQSIAGLRESFKDVKSEEAQSGLLNPFNAGPSVTRPLGFLLAGLWTKHLARGMNAGWGFARSFELLNTQLNRNEQGTAAHRQAQAGLQNQRQQVNRLLSRVEKHWGPGPRSSLQANLNGKLLSAGESRFRAVRASCPSAFQAAAGSRLQAARARVYRDYAELSRSGPHTARAMNTQTSEVVQAFRASTGVPPIRWNRPLSYSSPRNLWRNFRAWRDARLIHKLSIQNQGSGFSGLFSRPFRSIPARAFSRARSSLRSWNPIAPNPKLAANSNWAAMIPGEISRQSFYRLMIQKASKPLFITSGLSALADGYLTHRAFSEPSDPSFLQGGLRLDGENPLLSLSADSGWQDLVLRTEVDRELLLNQIGSRIQDSLQSSLGTLNRQGTDQWILIGGGARSSSGLDLIHGRVVDFYAVVIDSKKPLSIEDQLRSGLLFHIELQNWKEGHEPMSQADLNYQIAGSVQIAELPGVLKTGLFRHERDSKLVLAEDEDLSYSEIWIEPEAAASVFELWLTE